jgi:succinoglycan biosynthesis transport protein ExoP
MLRRRRRSRPPVLARVAAPPAAGSGARRLTRGQLSGFRNLLGQLGGARVVAIAGGEARSAVAVGLATAAVATPRRTVLVEADLARPRLAASLGLAQTPGLGEYLRTEAEAGEILQSLVLAGPVTEGPVEHLVCLVAGAAAPEAESLLASDGFGHAIARLRSAYELIVVAAPPDHRDGSLLAVSAQADMTVACCTRAEARAGRWEGVAGIVVVG